MATRRKQSSRANEQQGATDQTDAQESVPDRQVLDQEATQNLQQQITGSLRPVVKNLREQVGRTIREQVRQADTGAEEAEAEGFSLESLGGVGQALQSSIDTVADTLRRIWEWIVQMVQKLGDRLAELIGVLVGKLVQKAIKAAF